MFEPRIQNLTITDGQLAATATQITAGPRNVACKINLTLANTGTQDETVILTYSRAGGTQRRIWYGVLSPNWSARICGLPMNVDDILYGATTDAGVVDYVVSITGLESPLTMAIYNDAGLPASAPQVLDQLAVLTG